MDLDTHERPADRLRTDQLRTDDLRTVEQLDAHRLARLLYAVIGLSDQSVDLVSAMADRLRAAEGSLPDPLH